MGTLILVIAIIVVCALLGMVAIVACLGGARGAHAKPKGQ